MKKYLGKFTCKQDVIDSYEISGDNLDMFNDAVVICAYYDEGYCDGSSYILFDHNDVLYEVHGSHCSCFGLEGQFSPEVTSIQSIEHLMVKGRLLACGSDEDYMFLQMMFKMYKTYKETKDERGW